MEKGSRPSGQAEQRRRSVAGQQLGREDEVVESCHGAVGRREETGSGAMDEGRRYRCSLDWETTTVSFVILV